MSKPVTKEISSRGGRPSREQAEQIEARILDAASEQFFAHGYGVTSIEIIAKHAKISKRTFYDRYKDKSDIFRAVVHRMVEDLRTKNSKGIFEGNSCEEILHKLAQIMLQASLLPQGLALYRIVIAEALRFPELAMVMNGQGARQEAVHFIAGLLDKEVKAKRMVLSDTQFAAEQFIQMVVSVPQRRSLGLGNPMTSAELKKWARDSVEFFLRACRTER